MLLLLLACDSPPSTREPIGPAATPAPAPAEAAVAPAPPATPAEPKPPRAVADEAFNAAMRAYEGGSPEAATLVPRAIAAYGALPTVDSDGLFHLALLHLAAGDAAAARTTCEQGLARHPAHLLLLATAGKAAGKLGDAAGAQGYYQRLVAAWDQPREPLPEYEDHDRLLPIYQQEALGFLAAK